MLESRLFVGFTSKECNQFIEFAKPTTKKLNKEEVLCDEGAVVDGFGILMSGRLKGAKYRYNGALDLVEIYTKNDIINLEIACTPTRKSPVQLSAMEDSEILLFSHNIIKDTDKHDHKWHKVQNNIVQILANENVKKMYKIDVLYKKALRERIMVFLRHMEARLERDEFHIRMDREQFAQYLGVNRSALSHELSKMRKEGIIEFKKDYFKLLKMRNRD